MQFNIYSNQQESIATGELTYHIREISLDDGIMPQVHLFLAIDKFYSDITAITCDIGTFQDVSLLQISGASKEETVLYELTTFAFSLNVTKIEALLEQLNTTR